MHPRLVVQATLLVGIYGDIFHRLRGPARLGLPTHTVFVVELRQHWPDSVAGGASSPRRTAEALPSSRSTQNGSGAPRWLRQRDLDEYVEPPCRSPVEFGLLGGHASTIKVNAPQTMGRLPRSWSDSRHS